MGHFTAGEEKGNGKKRKEKKGIRRGNEWKRWEKNTFLVNALIKICTS